VAVELRADVVQVLLQHVQVVVEGVFQAVREGGRGLLDAVLEGRDAALERVHAELQRVVDGVGLGLQRALEAREVLLHGVLQAVQVAVQVALQQLHVGADGVQGVLHAQLEGVEMLAAESQGHRQGSGSCPDHVHGQADKEQEAKQVGLQACTGSSKGCRQLCRMSTYPDIAALVVQPEERPDAFANTEINAVVVGDELIISQVWR
jgi:hypothetical protein